MIKLALQFKNYAWGRKGKESLVSNLFSANRGVAVDVNEHYAELWAGVHPNGEAYVILGDNVCKLSEFLSNKGEKVLSYLLKVLSIESILSIQMHPDAFSAKLLNSAFPDVYPDNNHKPEMVIALTEFHMLCGFKSLQDIKVLIDEFPSLKLLLEIHVSDKCQNNLMYKNCLSSIFEMTEQELLLKIEQVKTDFYHLDVSTAMKFYLLKNLFNSLLVTYPKDPGCLVILLLNYHVLQPGQSVFVGPVMPHAYIKGECIEVMANSDNVVRLGLTPKVKDINSAFRLMETERNLHEGYFVVPMVESCEEFEISTYESPADEFVLMRIQGKHNFCNKKIEICKNSIILNLQEKVTMHFKSSIMNASRTDSLLHGSAVFIDENLIINSMEFDLLDLVIASPKQRSE